MRTQPAVADGDITAQPVLEPNVIYTLGQRFVHAETKCAGMTALYTAYGPSGEGPAVAVTPADVAEWATYDLGPLRCECGAMRATPFADANGRAIARAADDAE